MIVEYDGTTLSGWQRQQNAPTVQQHLEEALAQMLQHPTPVAGASRTDAGVHARGQVCAFSTERTIPLHGIRRGLNSLLPDTISIRGADEVDAEFHPRFRSTGKHYRYSVYRGANRSPRHRHRAWHITDALDLAAMREATAALTGEHDFSAFRATGCSANTTVRMMEAVTVTEGPDDLLWLDVRGNAFLRNMVRIMAGTLVEVGRGVRPAAEVPEIIASRDRTRAGITAPAHGLDLVEVRFDGIRKGPTPPGVSAGISGR